MCWLSNLVSTSQKNESEADVLASHLMIGNEKGEFMIYDVTGDLIVRQKLHTASVLGIRSRTTSMGLEQDALEDVSVVFQDVLCVIPLPELLAFIRMHEAGSGQSHDPKLKLAHGKFGFGRNHANRTSGVHLGVRNTSIKTQLKRADTDSEDTQIRFLSVGKSPAVGTFEATVRRSRGHSLIGQFAMFMASGLNRTPLSYGRRALRSFWSVSKEEDLQSSDATSLRFSLRDNKRHVQDLVPSPQGCLAVASDNLGRVLLMDTQQSLVIRVWKGYRDAQCAWITRPSSTSDIPELYLVIYGWRREALEVWPMRYGPRTFSLVVGSNCKILRTTPPTGMGDECRWETKCAVLDCENEEIWDVGEKAFPPRNEVEAVWDMMLQE